MRWTGQVQAQTTEDYTFHTLSDDGVKLWVNNQLLIDNWTIHGPTWNNSAPVSLQAGQKYDIKLEFLEEGGGTLVELDWSTSTIAQQVIPAANLFPGASENIFTATTAHTYNLSGQQATMLDPKSQTTTYGYDGVRRPNLIDYVTGTPDVAFTYNDAGNRYQMKENNVVTTTWSYDGVYRPTQIAAAFGNVNYGYNLLGLRQSLAYPDTKQAQYVYDGLNRLKTVNPVGSGQEAVRRIPTTPSAA